LKGAVEMFLKAFQLISTDPASPFDFVSADELSAIRKKHSLRRVDRYSLLMISAAEKLLESVQISQETLEKMEIFTVTAFGPHQTTFDFLDDILDYPGDQVLPQKFSYSVHNAAPAYLGMILKAHGAIYAFCGFEDAWFDALEFAKAALATGKTDTILLVGCDEIIRLTGKLHSMLPEHFSDQKKENAIAMLLTSKNDEISSYPAIKLCRENAPENNRKFFHFGCESEFIETLKNLSNEREITIHV